MSGLWECDRCKKETTDSTEESGRIEDINTNEAYLLCKKCNSIFQCWIKGLLHEFPK